jgi:transposase-like protein
MTDDNICGYEDTTTGQPCQRPAGWGTDRDHGYCSDHADDVDGPPAHRRSKLTAQRQESIAQMIENGHSIKAACRCNGISHQTFYEWLERGDEQDEGIFSDFSDRIARARGAGEQQLVDELLQMAREKGDTKTMLSVLKSRYPDSWGDADVDDTSGTVNIHLSPTDDA